ncbi:tRNA(Ile)-lysidine synthase [Auxenochlorella protothecoides]|uniref:tRNA(Ile)-lysidine synthetase n=1 Tax=Auxenochlorella protothecoides TaxID=3075 RepID=A0A087SML2_AUXPR|nr:tRNA(Ile)-lysidine synthase [Auxenochlorella protothecoides]KFM26966.1 tRNA(Ile)-lysidine synthase [Auxenochlorella protothecoides]
MAGRVVSAFSQAMFSYGLPPTTRLAIALSGGPDSMALAALLSAWHAEVSPDLPPPPALIVDHGLRPESGREAAAVAATASALGLAPRTAARAARYSLLLAACRSSACSGLLTAHHADDQEETFLLRLLHGSGLRGLACMAPLSPWPLASNTRHRAPATHAPPPLLLRPLLSVHKAELLAFGAAMGIPHVTDPTNATPAYQRNRLRALLGGAGPEVHGALQALQRACSRVAREARERGDAALDAASRASHGRFPPPSAAVDALAARLGREGKLVGSWTGGGCIVRPVPGSQGRLIDCAPQGPAQA